MVFAFQENGLGCETSDNCVDGLECVGEFRVVDGDADVGRQFSLCSRGGWGYFDDRTQRQPLVNALTALGRQMSRSK